MDPISVIQPFPKVLLELFVKTELLVNKVDIIQIVMADIIEHREIPYGAIPG